MNHPTLDLRGLSPEERNRKINEAIMMHVAQITMSCVVRVPDYVSSANDVLPLLEKHHPWRADCGGEHGYTVSVWKGPSENGRCYATSHANTFPLCACYALLSAAGISVLT